MNHARMTAKTFIFNILLLTVVSFPTVLNAQDGKALFQANCASCHGVGKALVGYVSAEGAKLKAAPAPLPGENPEGGAQESDNSLMYGILTLILAVIALV